MIAALAAALDAFERDDREETVLINRAGKRGFCAGGGIRALSESALPDGSAAREFWSAGYQVNAQIARYPKPVVAVIEGIVMGGIGLAGHASHRFATQNPCCDASGRNRLLPGRWRDLALGPRPRSDRRTRTSRADWDHGECMPRALGWCRHVELRRRNERPRAFARGMVPDLPSNATRALPSGVFAKDQGADGAPHCTRVEGAAVSGVQGSAGRALSQPSGREASHTHNARLRPGRRELVTGQSVWQELEVRRAMIRVDTTASAGAAGERNRRESS